MVLGSGELDRAPKLTGESSCAYAGRSVSTARDAIAMKIAEYGFGKHEMTSGFCIAPWE